MSQKIPKYFECKKCNYITSNKKDYNKHVLTLKHQNTTNTTKVVPKACKEYRCYCGKVYKHHSSLWNHKKICVEKSPNNIVDSTNDTIIALLKQNQEFKELILQQNRDITNITNNTYNTTTHNNQKFNLNFFLNTTCKDALNMTEFIENIEIDFKDIENIGRKGYVEGMTNMILARIRDLDITKRPLHCTDLKRETMYIKDNNQWEKDTPTNSKLHNMISIVAKQNYQTLPLWRQKHPDCFDGNHPQYSFCLDMMRNILGDVGEEQIRLDNKIIKNLSRHILVDKK
jgi:hypothetical protein